MKHPTTFAPAPARLSCTLIAAVCLLLLAAAPALASTAWRVTSVHGPQNMPPGGTGQYVIQAYNVGDAASSGTITVTDTLPAGFVATKATAAHITGQGSAWACSGTGTGTVTCTSLVIVPAPGASMQQSVTDSARGGAQPITINVRAPATPGTFDNQVTISGGGGAAASTVDPTPVSGTPAGFGFVQSAFLADMFDGAGAAASPVRQAGSHPFEMRVNFRANLALEEDPDAVGIGDLLYTKPDEQIKDMQTKLPAGLIGNPQATPQCRPEYLYDTSRLNIGACPTDTQVGTVDLVLNNGEQLADVNGLRDAPVYNMVPPPGTVAAFAFSYSGNPAWILISLDPADRYSVIATVRDTVEVLAVREVDLSLWGVPADPAHDALRVRTGPSADPAQAYGASSDAPIRPLLTLPSQCGVPGSIQMRMTSWQHPDAFTPWEAGAAATMTGCDDPRFALDPAVQGRFNPSISVRTDQTTTSTPTAVDVDVTVPQKNDTVTNASDLYAGSGNEAAIVTPPLRDATVTLPPGMVVSPSSADGLAACSPLQIGLGTNDAPTCPDASRLGTVTIDTPLLADPLRGWVYLAAQNDNPFGTTLAIYLVASGPGVVIKLPGKVEPDPVTGQLTTTFDDNPQIPFSHMNVHFDGGPRAALVTPPTCGEQTATAVFTAWNGSLPAVQSSSTPFTIDGNCAKGFDPGFVAGTQSASAGKDSPLVTRFTRSDADQELSGIDVSLPPGLLGRVAKLDLCGDAAANAGACGAGSLIGRATVGAGPGPTPFYITDGRVYMTGPYKGAPFGLSIVVHAQAGPLDLGDVVVRAAVFVDRTTSALRIVSNPLPTILDGIPLQLRVVDVTVDRAGFTFNPTSCAPMNATATLTSTGGSSSTKRARFQATGCNRLRFAPTMKMYVGSRGHTRAGASTPLTADVRMPSGDANLKLVKVVLPTTLNARLPVISRACTLAEFQAGHCAKAKAGTATAVTPLLRAPLRGGVYFVRNGKPLPDMMVALRGQVAVDLDARISIPGGKHLSTTFATVPDVPISRFILRLVSGRQGPLGAVSDLCTLGSRTRLMALTFQAQSGKVVRASQAISVRGCAKPKPRRKPRGAKRR